VDARFLRSQYRDIMVVSVGLLLLALVGAWMVARRWVRPLHAVSDAAARIARGEFDVRMTGAKQGQGRSDEIGDLVRSVNHMAEGLQRLEGARRRWLADISHELRTPLAVLRGEIEALVDGVRPLRHEAVLSLRDEVLRLGKLVDDLHLLAMSDLQALPCQFEDNDAATLVDRMVRRFEPRAQAAGLSLRVQGMTSALPVVWDGARIEQMLGNLLENSLRYTDKPGEIVLTLQRSGERVTIELDDSAPGVPEADLPHLFEPLYSADAARSRQRGGSGLGLAICDAIARSHGGRIEARASRLGGLHVRVDLLANAGAAA
jgi:two-component system sensor histidine kinase BaeS